MIQIVTLKDLQDEGKKIAFIKGNRSINKSNVNAKAKSFSKCGCNFVPLMYVSGTKAISEGLELVTTDNQPIGKDEADDYIVIIDGQHRFKAFQQAQLDPSKLYLFEAYADKPTLTLLSVANVEAKTWSPAEYLVGASISNKDNELLQACNKLQEEGFKLPTISKIYTWNGCLTKSKLSGLMQGKELNISNDLVDLERGNKFVEAAKEKFDVKFIAKRYLIDAVIDLSSQSGYDYDDVLLALSCLNDKEVRHIIVAKSCYKPEVIKEVLTSNLKTEAV
jgi:hypothetical protein